MKTKLSALALLAFLSFPSMAEVEHDCKRSDPNYMQCIERALNKLPKCTTEIHEWVCNDGMIFDVKDTIGIRKYLKKRGELTIAKICRRQSRAIINPQC
ncbi:hypothetical protein [Aliikangiella coralliicola]|uniref:Uncharacterized protein n=1 Tax=Aliikangiella coralliicola TaxID=2592383 RepID=A0A545UFF5_9GAMM|nr:hypothetical protein [Aliikangiella coralliicola]TQV88197.1 hypothetical protein FLL46_06620 [Aliikangiella coralliicola]